MKKTLTGIFLLISLSLISQESNNIAGVWFNQEKTAKIKVFKTTKGNYAGRIIWLKNPNDDNGKEKIDINNPDKSKRNRKINGMIIFSGLKWTTKEKRWEDGVIYDPEKGKTYSCYAFFTANNQNKLNLKGYILGMKLIGRTTTWSRVKQ